MPKVSVIVPVYNVSKYLRKCLDSIIKQTLLDIEIICINDGSTDDSLAVLQEYAAKDARVKILDKPNSGYGASMNLGVSHATGEYIGIVESDDWVEPDMFEKLYQLAVTRQADVVKSDFYYYWSVPQEKNCKANVLPSSLLGQLIQPRSQQLIFEVMPSIWSAVYKRSFIVEKHIRFLETPGASYQDTSFNFLVLAWTERMYITNDAFLHYRQDNMQSSVNSKGKVFCVCDEWHHIDQFLKKNSQLSCLIGIKNRNQLVTYWWNIKRLSGPLAVQFITRVSAEIKYMLRYEPISKWRGFPFKVRLQTYLWGYIPALLCYYWRQRNKGDF